jgi:hypothetical protein
MSKKKSKRTKKNLYELTQKEYDAWRLHWYNKGKADGEAECKRKLRELLGMRE